MRFDRWDLINLLALVAFILFFTFICVKADPKPTPAPTSTIEEEFFPGFQPMQPAAPLDLDPIERT